MPSWLTVSVMSFAVHYYCAGQASPGVDDDWLVEVLSPQAMRSLSKIYGKTLSPDLLLACVYYLILKHYVPLHRFLIASLNC